MQSPRPDKRFKQQYHPILTTQQTLLDEEIEWLHKISCEYVAEYSASSSEEANRDCPIHINIDDIPEEQALQNANELEKAMLQMFGNKEPDRSIEVVPNR